MILKLANQNPGLCFSKIFGDCKGTRAQLESFHVTHVSSSKGTIQLPALSGGRCFEQGKKMYVPQVG